MTSKTDNITVIIPSYKPDEKLLSTIRGILAAGMNDIIVVDDGGGDEYAHIFSEAEKIDGCAVIRHNVNRGKGAALKTAFEYFLENRPDSAGVVTADADGQHLTDDIAAVASKMVESGGVVLGCRDFSASDVPARSKFGNRCTSFVFKIFFGMKISDTQTGLRAIPREYVKTLMGADGDRYEYETNMLILIKRSGIPYEEQTISTVYIDDNSSSHFRPIRDSIRIYSMMLKFVVSSFSSSVADVLIYYLILKIIGDGIDQFSANALSTFIARVCSSLLNYFLNLKTVFKGKSDKRTLARYAVLDVGLVITSAMLVWTVKSVLHIKIPELQSVVKAFIDTMLFFVSFRVQHGWVFKNSDNLK